MSFALGLNTSQILARREFSPDETEKIISVIMRREAHEPLQYILGEAEFFGRDFCVGEGVLIPRHDTETLIEAALKHIPHEEKFSFIDWGTGSGCIAVTLMLEFTKSFAYMIENNPDAAKFASLNLEHYNLTHRAKIISSAEGISECRFIISNPPYIPSHEIASLMNDVKDYEPHSALDGGEDGMKFYMEIFSLSEKIHCEYIILETGSINQVQSLKNISRNFICCDEILNNGNFPRCLVFRRRNYHEETCG